MDVVNTPTEKLSRRNQQIRLQDGRLLGYDAHGPADGTPLFYFHGSPSSRLETALFVSEDLLQSLNIHLIAMDRPGMGLSDFKPGRRLLDWPGDIAALADHLQIERFSILGYSLSGPYALACAYAIPKRLLKVGIVSGAALFSDPERLNDVNPSTRRYLAMPREKPWMSRLFMGVMLVWMPRLAPGWFISGAASVLPGPDREIVFNDPAFQQGFLRMVREAMRQGTRGAYHESLLTITAWGFGLEDIPFPIHLWHGEADQNIPVEMARHMAAALPDCHAVILPEEGHLSLFKKHAWMILQALTSQEEAGMDAGRGTG